MFALIFVAVMGSFWVMLNKWCSQECRAAWKIWTPVPAASDVNFTCLFLSSVCVMKESFQCTLNSPSVGGEKERNCVSVEILTCLDCGVYTST